MTSCLPDFRNLPVEERHRRIAESLGMDPTEVARALAHGGLDSEIADKMVENAIGTFALPLGVALNFRINARDYLVPMVIEEPSVIAAASHAAKRVRDSGGFVADADRSRMTGQISVTEVPDESLAEERVLAARTKLLDQANAAIPSLVQRGGGARDISVRALGDGLVVVHITVDCCDAMGANLVNTVAEAIGASVAERCGGRVGLRILTNYCDQRLVRASVRVPVDALGSRADDGLTVARCIERASHFAQVDPYRAATHNKGIMNGIDAVVVATGNDWRAVEAGAHAHAAAGGSYRPLSVWHVTGDDRMLEGRIELPLALGIVGGALRAHAGAQLCLDIIGAKTAAELAMVAAAAGLATNLAALRALSTEGIQRGHMDLHHRAKSPPPAGS